VPRTPRKRRSTRKPRARRTGERAHRARLEVE
jgi:hypothetical protein